MPDSRSDVPIVIVANPHSGNGRAPAILTEAVDTLALFGHVVTICEDTLEQMQHELARHVPGSSAVVAIGGDGLIHRVTQHLAGTDTPLGIIPAGSGNDIARALRLRRNPSQALKEICNALTWPEFTQEIDLLKVRGADFDAWVVAVVSLGLDAKVNYRAVNKTAGWGRWRYVTALIGELAEMQADTYTISLDGGAPHEMTGIVAAVANLGYFGSGMQIAPMAHAKGQVPCSGVTAFSSRLGF
ncbi:hypothetical protein BSZ39_04775 [Bowdeniella nasicola]|uniref:DAGKc domain-containing protein n=1 Tax=Bowdeniella nasicola TaxID=208480 RepID=A0A1Q5Q372_9ACTO|nr:diacylglycerol kinase family protein [Bowdeniella nasicola]OKL54283.1 hypothetical protein BSZ39_04775 [Bowdeniella nasicola]